MYIVINGGGKVGEYLANVLLNGGHEVAIIEKDEETADRLSMTLEGRYLVIRGDGCNSMFQEDAGIRKADVFVATTGQDDNNLVSCEIASRVYGVPRCIARVNAPKNQRIFRALDIEGISSTALIATMIEEETLAGNVGAVTSLSHGNVILEEVPVPHMKTYDNTEGAPVFDIEMPENSLIAAVSKRDDVEVVNEDSVLRPGDTAIVIADREVMDEVRRVFHEL